jgi:pimeloyl-ACP methyl ester carboxylesterase
MWQWFNKVQAQTRPGPLLDEGDLLVHTDLSGELARITAPTLLLAPDSSPFVSLDIANEVHKLIAHSEMAAFPRSRHGLPFSHARECAETVLAFLTRHGFGGLAVWRFGGLAVWRFGGLAVWRFGGRSGM